MTARDDRSQRPPPAFQDYAADMLAAALGMTLDEVGLLTLMRWRYWVAGSLPRDRHRLGAEIGVDPRSIRARLTPPVLAHFAADPADNQRLICPELDRQKARLNERRAKQIAGGREGRARQLAGVTPEGNARVTPSHFRAVGAGVSEQNRTLSRRGIPTTSKEEIGKKGEIAAAEKLAARSKLTPELQAWADDYEKAS